MYQMQVRPSTYTHTPSLCCGCNLTFVGPPRERHPMDKMIEKTFITRISNQSHVSNEFINCSHFYECNGQWPVASIQLMVSRFDCFYTFLDLNKIILMNIQSNIVWDSLAVRSCILCTMHSIFLRIFQFIFSLQLDAYELDQNHLKFDI